MPMMESWRHYWINWRRPRNHLYYLYWTTMRRHSLVAHIGHCWCFIDQKKSFFHFDSLGNINSQASHQFVQRIKDALNCRNCQVKPIRCLQQANGYDCGIHVICMTDNIADKVNRYEYVEGVGPLHQYDFSKAPTTISLI